MAKKNIDLAVVLHDDCDYKDWLVELKERFYSHRLKASCATNGYLLDFYWKLGRDIEAKQYTNTYGSGFYKNLSQDLKNEMPGVKGFSPINLRYMSKFFKLYAPLYSNIPQTAELFSDSLSDSNVPQVAEQFEKRQQPVDDFNLLFSIPWDHHRRIIDKCKDDMDKALFFVRKTWEIIGDVMRCLIGLTQTYMSVMVRLLQISNLLFPKDFKSSMPTIEELEKGLKDN